MKNSGIIDGSIRGIQMLALFLFMVNCGSRKSDSSAARRIFLDTVVTNAGASIHLTAISNSDTTALLKSRSGGVETLIDTLEQATAIVSMEVIDFDKNGSADILLDYIGNNSTYFLYLFDSTTSTFRNIDNYLSFPDGQQLDSNRQLYYSYHRAGCADLNWASDLFTIKDFNIIHLAHLYAEGCGGEQEGISVYSVIDINSDSTTLIETIPYSGEENHDKWNILKKYWNENYSRYFIVTK